MIYKDFQDLKLSALGMAVCACLWWRQRRRGGRGRRGGDGGLRHGQRRQLLRHRLGVSQRQLRDCLGKALAKHPREKFYIADKFPGYDLSNMPKVQEIFEKQLEKCQVEYFDFYLFHNVCEMNIDAYLDPQYGIYEYLLEQKKNGRIRHLGFSAHGDYQ